MKLLRRSKKRSTGRAPADKPRPRVCLDANVLIRGVTLPRFPDDVLQHVRVDYPVSTDRDFIALDETTAEQRRHLTMWPGVVMTQRMWGK